MPSTVYACCSYRADAPLKGKCRVIMTLGCCADKGEGYQEDSKQEATEEYKPIAGNRGSLMPPLVDGFEGNREGPAYQQKPGPYYPGAAEDEDESQYNKPPVYKEDPYKAPEYQKDDYKYPEYNKDTNKAPEYTQDEYKYDKSGEHAPSERRQEEAVYEPRSKPSKPDFIDAIKPKEKPTDDYPTDSAYESEGSSSYPETPSSEPIVRYDPDVYHTEDPEQPKKPRFDFFEGVGTGQSGKDSSSDEYQSAEDDVRSKLIKRILENQGASRSPHVRGPVQSPSKKTFQPPTTNLNLPRQAAEMPKLQKPSDLSKKAAPAPQVPSQIPTPSISTSKPAKKITELPIFDAYRVKTEAELWQDAAQQEINEKQMPAPSLLKFKPLPQIQLETEPAQQRQQPSQQQQQQPELVNTRKKEEQQPAALLNPVQKPAQQEQVQETKPVQKPVELPKAEQRQVEQPRPVQEPFDPSRAEQQPVKQPKAEQRPVEQHEPVQEPIDPSRAEKKPVEQPQTEQRHVEQPKPVVQPVQKPFEQPQAEQKPVEQPKPMQKPVEQPKPMQKPVEQPKAEQKPAEPLKPVPVEQPKAVQKPVEQPKAEQKPVEQPKPVPVEQPKAAQKPVELPKAEQKPVEQPKLDSKPAANIQATPAAPAQAPVTVAAVAVTGKAEPKSV